MVEVVQGVISAHVGGPLLDGTRVFFELVKTMPTGIVDVGADGVTVEEFALTRCRPKESDPMLSRQVDGICVDDGTSRIRHSTRHFVGTVHVGEILANDWITLTRSS